MNIFISMSPFGWRKDIPNDILFFFFFLLCSCSKFLHIQHFHQLDVPRLVIGAKEELSCTSVELTGVGQDTGQLNAAPACDNGIEEIMKVIIVCLHSTKCESIIKELIISPVMGTGWGLIPANRPRDNYAPCKWLERTSLSLAAQMGRHKRCCAPTG